MSADLPAWIFAQFLSFPTKKWKNGVFSLQDRRLLDLGTWPSKVVGRVSKEDLVVREKKKSQCDPNSRKLWVCEIRFKKKKTFNSMWQARNDCRYIAFSKFSRISLSFYIDIYYWYIEVESVLKGHIWIFILNVILRVAFFLGNF